MTKIEIFPQFFSTSKYLQILTQIDIFRKNLTIINIFCNFVQNRHFSKFWPKSRISSTFIEDRDFSKILTKFEILVNYDQNRDLFFDQSQSLFDNFDWNKHFVIFWPNRQFCPKSRLFDKFDQIWDFSTFLTQIDTFENFDQNRDFLIYLTKIDKFANFDQNRHFSEISTKTKIWGKFYRRYWLKSRFSENVDQDQDFPTILTKIEIFINIQQNRNFS